jgi:selenoprotein W-related protein
VSLASDLLQKFEPEIDSLVLIPSDGGKYEVNVNGQSIYSKLQTGRHAEPGEVVGLMEQFLKK